MANTTKSKKKTGKRKTVSAKPKKMSVAKPNTKRRTNTKAKPSPKTKKDKKTLLLVVISAVLLLALLISFISLSTAKHNRTVVTPDKDVAYGIDVSSHNGEIDWSAVKSQVDFAFIRVGFRGYSEGEINFDQRFDENIKAATEQGIPVGVYFYTQAINEDEAKEEAEFVLEKIKKYDISLPVVIDFEYAFSSGRHIGRLYETDLNSKDRTSIVRAFCDRITKGGYTPGIYASTYIFESQINLKNIDDSVYIWVADYNSEVTYDGYYDFWQYSESETCEGITSAGVDADYWYTNNRR